MNCFRQDAQSLLDAARAGELGKTAILVTAIGRRTIRAPRGSLDSLARLYGARYAFLVTRGLNRVIVEGRQAERTLRLETATNSAPISDRSRHYHIVPINGVIPHLGARVQ